MMEAIISFFITLYDASFTVPAEVTAIIAETGEVLALYRPDDEKDGQSRAICVLVWRRRHTTLDRARHDTLNCIVMVEVIFGAPGDITHT